MTDINISTRISVELNKQLAEYMKSEHLETSAAIRKLLYDALGTWKEHYALQLLAEGKVTLLKAAELAGMDVWAFSARLKDAKVPWVSSTTIEKDLEEFR